MATITATEIADAPKVRSRRRGNHPLLRFIVKRVLAGVATLFAASAVIFFATQVLPGNVAQIVLGRNATPAAVTSAEARLHLDRPVVLRYFSWLGNALRGNLGDSAVQIAQGAKHAPVSHELATPLLNSLILAGITSLLLIPLSVLLGVYAAMRAGKLADQVTSLATVVIGAFPEFVFGTLLIVIFFGVLDVLPPVAIIPPGQSPFSHLSELVLPVVTLLGVTVASAARQVRAGMIEVFRQEYVGHARINGVSRLRVMTRYALRNALPAYVQIMVQNLQYLLGGIIIVEGVFAYPGVGTFLLNAVNARDVTQVEGASLILAAAYIVLNIIADTMVVLLVPKLRTGQ